MLIGVCVCVFKALLIMKEYFLVDQMSKSLTSESGSYHA